MKPSVFLAGASGVIGRAMVPLLLADGWRVTGTTRKPGAAERLRALGIEVVLVDVFDARALARAVADAAPSVVVHQLTDLATGAEPANADVTRARNARLREEGTRNLIAAAVAAGAERFVAQSISFAYAPGQQPYREDAPLNDRAAGTAGVTARGVASLEQQVTSAPLASLVLRYGRLYGPGTGVGTAPQNGPLHVAAAAETARRALTTGAPGIYNIAEDDGFVAVDKARRESLLPF